MLCVIVRKKASHFRSLSEFRSSQIDKIGARYEHHTMYRVYLRLRDSMFLISGWDAFGDCPHSSVNYVRIRRTAEVDNVPCETGHPMWAHGYIVDIYTSGPMVMFVPVADEWAHGVLYRDLV